MKVVSERLGHANVAFTMNVYQHVLPGMQAEAAATFAQLLEMVAEDADPPLDEEPEPRDDGGGAQADDDGDDTENADAPDDPMER